MSLKEDYIKSLKMEYLAGEGGYFCETYRAIKQQVLVDGNRCYKLSRTLSQNDTVVKVEQGESVNRDLYTTIYYLIENTNEPHVNKSDIIHFFHDGCSVKYSWIMLKTGQLFQAVLGKDIARGQRLHLMVPGDSLKWATVLPQEGISENIVIREIVWKRTMRYCFRRLYALLG